MSEGEQRFSAATIVTGIIVPLLVGVPTFVALFDGPGVSAPTSADASPSTNLPDSSGLEESPTKPEVSSEGATPDELVSRTSNSGDVTALIDPASDSPDAPSRRELETTSGSIVEMCEPTIAVRVTLQEALSQVLLQNPETRHEAELPIGEVVKFDEGCNVSLLRITRPLRGPTVAHLEW